MPVPGYIDMGWNGDEVTAPPPRPTKGELPRPEDDKPLPPGVNISDGGAPKPQRAPGYEQGHVVKDKAGNSKTFGGPNTSTDLRPKQPAPAPMIYAQDAIAPVGIGGIVEPRVLAMGQIDAARGAALGTMAMQNAFTPTLQAAAAGQVPSAAQIQARADLNRQNLAQMRAAAAVRGGAPAIIAAQHAAGAGLGPMQGQAIAQGGAARAAEIQRAQAVLAQNLLSGRAGQIGLVNQDAAVAAANADLLSGARLQNQDARLRAGVATLGQQTTAAGMDQQNALRLGIESQRQGLADQESYDARQLALANMELAQAQQDAQATALGNAAYVDKLGLGTQQRQLAARAKMGAFGLSQQQAQADRDLAAGILQGVAAPMGALAINLGQQQPASPAYGSYSFTNSAGESLNTLGADQANALNAQRYASLGVT